MAEILARLAIHDDLPRGVGGEIDDRNRVAPWRPGCLGALALCLCGARERQSGEGADEQRDGTAHASA